MLKVFKKICSELKGSFIFRYCDTTTRRIILINNEVKECSVRRYKGLGITCYYENGIGFSSTSSLSYVDIYSCAKNALYSASLNKNFNFIEPDNEMLEENIIKIKIPKITKNLSDKDYLKNRINMLKQIFNRIKDYTNSIDSIYISYSENKNKKLIFKNDVLIMDDFSENNSIMLNYHAMSEKGLERIADVYQVKGDWTLFNKKFDMELLAIELAKSFLKKINSGIKPEKGNQKVVLGPKVVSTLIHEAIGHSVEADFVNSGSIAKGMLNKLVASPIVNIRDIGFSDKYSDLPISMTYDDEGNFCKDVSIIDKGYLVNFLHNNSSSHNFSCINTGNARANLYNDYPLIRMRNTYLLPKNKSQNELFKELNNGYYLKRVYNGQSDINCEFNFTVIEGYKIENGIITTPLRDHIITGQGFEVLKAVKEIGNDFEWGFALCGKEQLVMVGQGAPSILTEIYIGG